MLQSIAWQVSTVLILALLLVFWYVAVNAGEKREAAGNTLLRWRGPVFWILVVAFVPIIGYTLIGLPYSPPRDRVGEPTIVAVRGQQWRWDIEPGTVPVRRPVEFHVTSADVNHGFAIYDADLKLVAQTQAMPGYTNLLHVNFSRPGTYRVLCLEYCGLAHHKMMAEITVTETN
jgi:cytochrome c oxidase subunit 2